METAMLLILPAVAVVVATLSALVARRRRTRSTAATLSWISTITVPSTAFVTMRPDVEEEPVSSGDTLQVRILRNQVRSLEEALEQEQLHHATDSGNEDLELYRRRVHAVIRAMGGKLDTGAAAPEALARVSAAVDRLSVRDPFTRPTLSPALAGGVVVAGGVAGGVAVMERPAVVADLPPADVVGEAFEADEAAVVVDEMPSVPISTEREVVLPVPPVAESDQNRRNRRWFRGRAA
jgi:hypothetical protein